MLLTPWCCFISFTVYSPWSGGRRIQKKIVLGGFHHAKPRRLESPVANWLPGITYYRFWIRFIIPVHYECSIRNRLYLKNQKSPPQKKLKNPKIGLRTLRIFWHDKRNYLGIWKLRISRPPLSFALIFMKDAHSAESNKKSIFRVLFSELSWKLIKNWQFWVQK